MKINKKQMLRKNSILQWLVIEGLTKALTQKEFEPWVKKNWLNAPEEVDIVLTVA